MFYANNDLEDLIACPNCGDIMNDPRILPCGNTLCHKCIFSNSKYLNCYACNQVHSIPSNGFMRNETIIRFLKKRPHEIFRSRKIEDLKSLLNKLKNASKELEDSVNYSENKIQKHLDSVMCEVDLAAENAIAKIQDSRDKLLNEINDYKLEIDNLKQLRDEEKSRFNEKIIKIREFHDRWFTYINKLNINQEEIDKAILDTKRQINTAQKEYYKCQSQVFNDKFIQFEPIKSESHDNLLGSMKYSCLPGPIDTASFREFDLVPYLKMIIDFDLFSDGKILIVGLTGAASNKIRLLIFNQDFCLLSYRDINILEYSNDEEIQCAAIGEDIFLTRFSDLNPVRQRCFKINSTGFEIKKKIKFDRELIDYSSNNNFLFFLTSDFKISIYDNDLNLLNIVGQSISKDLEYFIPKNTVNIYSNDDYLFLEIPSSKIILLDQKNGKYAQKIKLDDLPYLNVTSDSYFVTYDSSELRFMSINGEKTSIGSFKSAECLNFKEKNNMYFFVNTDLEKLYIQ